MIITKQRNYQADVLAVLRAAPDRLSAAEIARQINGNGIAVREALRGLKAAGLVTWRAPKITARASKLWFINDNKDEVK